MKIAITGHTSGIGKALLDYFQSQGHNCIGFSRSNGFDIKNKEPIIDKLKDVDIFINNAYINFDNSQLDLLKTVHQSFPNIYIINISSRITDFEVTDSISKVYSITKKLQDEYCKGKKNITNLKLGMVDTPRVKDLNGPRMPVSDVVDIVKFILENKSKFNITTLTVGL